MPAPAWQYPERYVPFLPVQRQTVWARRPGEALLPASAGLALAPEKGPARLLRLRRVARSSVAAPPSAGSAPVTAPARQVRPQTVVSRFAVLVPPAAGTSRQRTPPPGEGKAVPRCRLARGSRSSGFLRSR